MQLIFLGCTEILESFGVGPLPFTQKTRILDTGQLAAPPRARGEQAHLRGLSNLRGPRRERRDLSFMGGV